MFFCDRDFVCFILLSLVQLCTFLHLIAVIESLHTQYYYFILNWHIFQKSVTIVISLVFICYGRYFYKDCARNLSDYGVWIIQQQHCNCTGKALSRRGKLSLYLKCILGNFLLLQASQHATTFSPNVKMIYM